MTLTGLKHPVPDLPPDLNCCLWPAGQRWPPGILSCGVQEQFPKSANDTRPGKGKAQDGTLFCLSSTTIAQKLIQGRRAKGSIFVMNNPHLIFKPSICQTTLIFSFPAILRHTQVFLFEWIEVLDWRCTAFPAQAWNGIGKSFNICFPVTLALLVQFSYKLLRTRVYHTFVCP